MDQPESASIEPGQTLDHYRVESLLGRGGMGEVYRAWDMELERWVALKVLPSNFAADAERTGRFSREAKALAALNHPNIVTVYSVEAAAPVPYLTMELIEGRSLSDSIPRGGLRLDRFFDLAVPLADALAAAHDRGIVHRDLKPANVMVDRRQRLKILDFGLAKAPPAPTGPEAETVAATATLETATGVVLGTLGYMSPEQVKGEQVDARSDVFSLGLILYEMATGTRAFAAPTSAEMMSAVLRDAPSSAEVVRPELPRHLGRVIRRCLEKDPERRYQSAKDVRNELDDLARELRIDSVAQSRLVPENSAVRRQRPFWSVVLLLVAIFLIAGWVAFRLVRRGVEGPTAVDQDPIRSLAVLPFANLMDDPEQDFFVEGMHEALITSLSKIGTLRVISRTSAMRYAVTDKSMPEIARELDVDALVEGSVLRAEGEVRITAQLIDGTSDRHLWAESYDRRLEDVLALLSDVAREIAEEIEVALTPEQQRRLSPAQQVDPAAWDLFLRGVQAFNRFRADGYRDAVRHFNDALEIQPDFAEAYARLAGVHLLLGGFGIEDPKEQERLARQNAERAIELDPDSAIAYGALGWLQLYFHWDWAGAAELFERALELNPYGPYACHGYGDYLTVMGRAEEGLEYLKRAARADPLSPIANAPVVGHELYSRHYDEAVRRARQLLEIDPDYPAVRWFLAEALWHQGKRDEALAEYRWNWQQDTELIAALDRAAAEGAEPAMGAMARVLAGRASEGGIGPLTLASYFALAGLTDEAFHWLEVAYEQRVPQLMLIKQQPTWDAIRNDDRFDDLVHRIGIPG